MTALRSQAEHVRWPGIEGELPSGLAKDELRVAIVHDYLTQRGGAERVVLALLETFPNARLVTSVYDADRTFPEFAQYEVETTWLNRVSAFRRDPRRALAMLPAAFSGQRLNDVDLVICSSSGWSHGIRTSAPKVVYCHNPARWLYQRHEYVGEHGPFVRGLTRLLAPCLKWWDRRASRSVTTYLANSRAVASRIDREYGRLAEIVPPAVTIDPTAEQEPLDGVEPGFLLCVSRARGYKNTEAVCRGAEASAGERLVVVGGLPEGNWSSRLLGAADVSDAQLRWLYANCSAVVAASYEDFGLTPVEGYVFGKPALCLRAGGFLDTLVEGRTGFFFDELSEESVAQAIKDLRASNLSEAEIAEHGRSFGLEAFKARLRRRAASALGCAADRAPRAA